MNNPAKTTGYYKIKASTVKLMVSSLFLTLAAWQYYDWKEYLHPMTGTLEFIFSESDCRTIMRGHQSSVSPCTITTRYAVHPWTKALILYTPSGEVTIPNWKRELVMVRSPTGFTLIRRSALLP